MKIVTRLLRWYKKYGRKLPWRETNEPYKILVSEIMLQQTQVSRVIEFYHHWLEKFPNWESLAKASNADVIHAWAGLGYNRRALMLRDAARQVVEKGVPKSEKEWLALKGVGPYTAAALTVFSLRMKSMPVDTNIRRVIGRVFLHIPYPDLKDDEKIRKAGEEELLSTKEFYDVPQALFDLATIHCTKIPDCASCPLRNHCASADDFLAGKIEAPQRMVKKAKEKIHRNKKFPDRIYRGRILKVVREQGRVNISDIGSKIDKTFEKKHDQQWVRDMISRLIKDRMLKENGSFITLA